MPSTIVVLGAPGAGKSTVGRLLASSLGLSFTDVDARIEAEQGKPIREIFADSGEAHFRELEREATLACLAEGGVISLGGGAVMTPAIREAVSGLDVVWLQVSIAQATRRIGMNQARPLLLGNLRAQLIQLLAERTPVYAELATIVVDSDHNTPRQIVDHIVSHVWGAHT
ncbi:MAG: shikimate kinase [Micropruina sp.]|nr:shikimate kinase [Micropruina sp.]